MKIKKQYIVRKYVLASSALEALKIEKQCPVEDIYVDEDWKKLNYQSNKPIGFKN